MRILVILLAGTVLLCVPMEAAAKTSMSPTIEGHWEGVIVIRPAEFEVDLTLDVARQSNRSLVGEISYPTQSRTRYSLQSVGFEDSRVFFVAVDEHQVKSSFEGMLSSDGQTIKGDLTEGEGHYLFTLNRSENRPAGQPAMVQTLSKEGSELRSRFNKDKGKIRLMLILSPT